MSSYIWVASALFSDPGIFAMVTQPHAVLVPSLCPDKFKQKKEEKTARIGSVDNKICNEWRRTASADATVCTSLSIGKRNKMSIIYRRNVCDLCRENISHMWIESGLWCLKSFRRELNTDKKRIICFLYRRMSRYWCASRFFVHSMNDS